MRIRVVFRLLVVAFAVYAVVTDPAGSADMVRQVLDWALVAMTHVFAFFGTVIHGHGAGGAR